MTTISPHTTRANGTILTAAIYNADHNNHITNAMNLNATKLEVVGTPVVDGQGLVWDGTSGALVRSTGATPAIDRSGTAILDFGAFPGKSDASLAITGQTAIVAGSKVRVDMRLVASADHTADEHMLESINLFAGNIVAGTGFTIYGVNSSEISDILGWGTRIWGTWNVNWSWA